MTITAEDTMATFIDTGVPDIAAAHITVYPSDFAADRECTIIWSTREVRCPRFVEHQGHDYVQYGPGDVPPVDLRDGLFAEPQRRQCLQCGVWFGPPITILPGHLGEAEIAEAAKELAAERQADTDDEVAEIRAELESLLAAQAAEIAAGRARFEWLPEGPDEPYMVGRWAGRLNVWAPMPGAPDEQIDVYLDAPQ